jgi:hypothetical protein
VEFAMPPENVPQTDIHDIKDIILLPAGADLFTIGLSIGAALLCLGLLMYLLRRRRRPKPERPLIPHETARESLAHLARENLLEQGRDKEFHFALSEIIRLYVERRFDLPASDRTLDEIKRDIGGISQLGEALCADLLLILSEGDLVKFADLHLSTERSSELLGLAQNFVEQTIPSPAAASKV